MAKLTLTYGQLSNDVPYLTFDGGANTLLFLLGGPGNTLPVGADPLASLELTSEPS